MNIKLSSATRKTVTGIAGIAVMGWALVMSAYSIYFVTRHLGVPHFFAAGGSLAYDGGAVFSAAKALQAAQDGRSGINARMATAAFVALSAFCNALHPILGNESLLAIPYWAGLPVAAAWMFEIHTSQARQKAQARMGKRYPAPLPAFGGVRWTLFPLDTLNKLRDFAFSQGDALMNGNGLIPRKILKARRRAEYAVLSDTEPESVAHAYLPVASHVTGSVTVPVTNHEAPSVPDAYPPGANQEASSVSGETVSGPGATPGTDVPVTEQSPVTAASSPVSSGRVSGPGPGRVPRLGVARNCEQCGTSFVTKTAHGRFCKDTCRVAWNRAKKQSEEAS